MRTARPAVAAALILLAHTTPAGAAGTSWTLAFDPPDGTTFIQSLRTTRVSTLGALGRRTEVTESRTMGVVARTGEGMMIEWTVLSGSMTRDGKAIEDPLLDVIRSLVVTHVFDAEGELIDVLGFEELADRLEESLPPAAMAALGSTLTEEAMIDKEAAEWEGRTGSFIGRTVEVGSAWSSVDEFSLPGGGAVTFFSATKVAEAVPCGDRECLRIEFSYDSDAKALESFLGSVLEGLADSLGAPPMAAEGTSIRGGGERIVDPATLLIRSETITRTMTMLMDVPGQGKHPLTTEERREYRFEYGE